MQSNPEKFENYREAEPYRESKEAGEKEVSPELARAALKERADFLVKEVKTSKNQMQNILHHMGQVKSAIKKLRALLMLSDSLEATSLDSDQKRVQDLRAQIETQVNELRAMEEDLVSVQMHELRSEYPHALLNDIEAKAREMVEDMLAQIR